MTDQRDPVEAGLGSTYDLYDIADWEVRTRLDRLAVAVHSGLRRVGRWALIAAALAIFAAQLGFSAYASAIRPSLGALTVLSTVPALLLVGYIWYGDPTNREPVDTIAITFLLGVLFASFAAVANSVLQVAFRLVPVVGMGLFFYLVVGPVEETVKWLAVRVHAFDTDDFDAVIDGAVYGAVAGLGFATIENALYITQEVFRATQSAGVAPLRAGVSTATSRAFAGPGHVIYSAFAGYYLGLAKFNAENAGPIAVKGLLIAAFIHGTYNTLVTYLPFGIGTVSSELTFFGFIVVFDGVVLYALYRKLRRYRSHHQQAVEGSDTASN
ncbi:MAG: PrsW family glutamic-type intramembrane protease [Halobacteriales archaeon]|nr:PrsW family glutamic-type intramembrane protease [Halobacteriales archaeon]